MTTKSQAEEMFEAKRKAEIKMAATIRAYLKLPDDAPIDSDLFYNMSNTVFEIYDEHAQRAYKI